MINLASFLASVNGSPVIVGAATTIILFFLTLVTKNFIEARALSSKLETEHKFDQRKKIKEVLAKYKVHLLLACEELNYRLTNIFEHNIDSIFKPGEQNPDKDYSDINLVYRILCVYAWIAQLTNEMIFLDTTIAEGKDIEFIKFLRVLSHIFSDERIIVQRLRKAEKRDEFDRIKKGEFETLPEYIISNGNIISFSQFKKKLQGLRPGELKVLFDFLDDISPKEDRMRWDRLHLFHLTLLVFLNNYGYDYQQTNEEEIKRVLEFRKSNYLKSYFYFIESFKLGNNDKVIQLRKIAEKYL